jgi:hypothetical protein
MNLDRILKNLILYNPVNKKIRLGHQADGGYIIIDGYNYDYFISGGVGENITFEIDFIKKYPDMTGIIFDNTVNDAPSLPKEVKLIKKNIGFDNTETTTNLSDYVNEYENIFIKMDIEGSEWKLLRSEFSKSLMKIKQIVFEAHHFFGVFSDIALESLEIINKTHYLVHIHQNNNGIPFNTGNILYPSLLELTFIRKDCEIKGLNVTDLPIKDLDFTNMPGKIEYDIMNKYPFNSKEIT